MNILFLDVASGSGLLACSTEERIVALRAIDHRVGDHDLAHLMEEALREAGWSFFHLTHLACIIGPGGFTSLRVGVSCINALSWALKIPVAGIHLSELYAARMPPSPSPFPPAGEKGDSPLPRTGEGLGVGGALWLHSTKRTELFVRGFGDLATEWPDFTHITIGDLLSKLQSPETYNLKPITYTGELLPDHQKLIEDAGAASLPLHPLTDIFPRFLASRAYREQILQPWYGRGW